MKKRPYIYLIIGIFFLIVPTVIYLIFLIPQLKEEYNVLLSSGGVVATGGMYGSTLIPDKVKFSSLYKTAARSFTLLVVITLVQEFVGELIGLAVVVVVSFIIFSIFKEIWKNARRKRENAELAKEIARSIDETSK